MKKSIGVLVLGCFISSSALAASLYHVTDLAAGPLALNDTGQIVVRQYQGGQETASVWNDGQITIIKQCKDTSLYLAGINNSGQLVGTCTSIAPGGDYAFRQENGNLTVVENTRYWEINQQGEILGQEWISDNQGFILRSDGTKEYLPYTAGKEYIGISINDSGQVAGATDFFSSEYHAFVWDSYSGTRELMPRAGDNISVGLRIDNQSRVVGYSVEALDYSNFDLEMNMVYWNPLGELVDLNCTYRFFGNSPYMNDQGQIVGMFKIAGSGDFLPYLWQEDTGFILLEGLLDNNWTITSITGINNLGQIIGYTDNGHGVLLTPVPEPAGILLLLMGTALIKKYF